MTSHPSTSLNSHTGTPLASESEVALYLHAWVRNAVRSKLLNEENAPIEMLEYFIGKSSGVTYPWIDPQAMQAARSYAPKTRVG